MKRLIVSVLGLVAAAAACGDPTFVDRVTIANPYEYHVIAAVGADGESWLNLGRVDRGDEVARHQVVDMGDRWFFRFRYPYDGAVEPVVVSLTRSELAGAGWRVEVPASLAETLRQRREPASYGGG